MNRIKAVWWILLGRAVAFRVVVGPSSLSANGPRRLYFTECKIAAVPADVLRDVKAQSWQEGAEDYAHWHGMPFDDQLRAENYERVRESIPYRETKEQG